eukprot:scaffold124842_cov45-Prasinocladus_malaysianus.AAC.1
MHRRIHRLKCWYVAYRRWRCPTGDCRVRDADVVIIAGYCRLFVSRIRVRIQDPAGRSIKLVREYTSSYGDEPSFTAVLP